MSNAITALPYYGGKSSYQNQGTGKWIASLLPMRPAYAEPFAGMLGILLQRDPVQYEIANDRDECIINWWRIVRDDPDSLMELIDNTPISDSEYKEQQKNLHHPDSVRRAFAAHYVLSYSMSNGLSEKKQGFKYNWKPFARRYPWKRSRMEKLRRRIRNVNLVSMDAVEILHKTASYDEYTIYCDPPYANADTTAYRVAALDRDAFADALQAQSGAVAVSGYGDEWNFLGWNRIERECITSIGAQTPRTEVLWLNYDPAAYMGPLYE